MGMENKLVVAIRAAGEEGHEHIIRVQFDDGTDESAIEAISAIDRHVAHYWMTGPTALAPRLVQVRQCPDCLARVLWA